MLQLAAQGYLKVIDDSNIDNQLESLGVSLYCFSEWECPNCSAKHQQVTAWPYGISDRGDAGFGAALNANGQIFEWFAFETYAGSTVALDPDSEMDQVVAAIDSWLTKEAP